MENNKSLVEDLPTTNPEFLKRNISVNFDKTIGAYFYRDRPENNILEEQLAETNPSELVNVTIDNHIDMLPKQIKESLRRKSTDKFFEIKCCGCYVPNYIEQENHDTKFLTEENRSRSISDIVCTIVDLDGPQIRFCFDHQDHDIALKCIINNVAYNPNKHGHIFYSSINTVNNNLTVVYMTSYDAGEEINGAITNVSATYSFVINRDDQNSLKSVGMYIIDTSDYNNANLKSGVSSTLIRLLPSKGTLKCIKKLHGNPSLRDPIIDSYFKLSKQNDLVKILFE
jgi:hypothetical protein